MITLLVKAALVLTILFSSMGGTAVLSAATLPDSPIYPIKLLLEEARLSMTNNPANQTALHLAFAAERAEEMAALAALNRAPSEELLANYQMHWREALRLAGELPDDALQAVMVQAQIMAGSQEALMVQAQVEAGSLTRTRLQDAAESVMQVQTAVALGLQSQNTFRWRVQNLPEDWPGAGAGPGFGPGDPEGDIEPPGGYTPGPGYGPGDGPYGPGEGDGPYGPGEGEGPYGPGEGEGPYGPGEGEGLSLILISEPTRH